MKSVRIELTPELMLTLRGSGSGALGYISGELNGEKLNLVAGSGVRKTGFWSWTRLLVPDHGNLFSPSGKYSRVVFRWNKFYSVDCQYESWSGEARAWSGHTIEVDPVKKTLRVSYTGGGFER